MIEQKLIKCPHCGESYYREDSSTSTLLYFAPVYKDGVNITRDGNIRKTSCTCLVCHSRFYYAEQYGEVQKVELIGIPTKPEPDPVYLNEISPTEGGINLTAIEVNTNLGII